MCSHFAEVIKRSCVRNLSRIRSRIKLGNSVDYLVVNADDAVSHLKILLGQVLLELGHLDGAHRLPAILLPRVPDGRLPRGGGRRGRLPRDVNGRRARLILE